jgi:hypothetical protein
MSHSAKGLHLTKEDADRANELWRKIDEKIVLGKDTYLKIAYSDFSSSEEIDESYFLDES